MVQLPDHTPDHLLKGRCHAPEEGSWSGLPPSGLEEGRGGEERRGSCSSVSEAVLPGQAWDARLQVRACHPLSISARIPKRFQAGCHSQPSVGLEPATHTILSCGQSAHVKPRKALERSTCQVGGSPGRPPSPPSLCYFNKASGCSRKAATEEEQGEAGALSALAAAFLAEVLREQGGSRSHRLLGSWCEGPGKAWPKHPQPLGLSSRASSTPRAP